MDKSLEKQIPVFTQRKMLYSVVKILPTKKNFVPDVFSSDFYHIFKE